MIRMVFAAVLFFGGMALPAAPAMAGYLDRVPVDWGCWGAVAMGLISMGVGFRAALREE